MGNTNKKESPRNPPKEDMIPIQPSLNDSKAFTAKPLMESQRQFRVKDNQIIAQNEIASQRNQFLTFRPRFKEQGSQYFIKREKNPSLRFIKGLSSLDCTLYQRFSKDFKYIPQTKALRALKLSLVKDDLLTSEKGISSIKDIKTLKYLRNIQINCEYHARMSHKMINFLFTSLKYCSNLVVVQLNIYNRLYISKELLTSLFRTLRGLKSLNPLSVLELKFYRLDSIKDEDIETLMKSLEFHKNLSKLSLQFSECFRVADELLESFGLCLRSLQNLSFLKLDVSPCYALTDAGMEHLYGGISAMKPNCSLDLRFTGCKHLTFCNFLKGTQDNSIASLNLAINFEESIHYKQRNIFSQIEAGLSSLKSLTWDFAFCDLDDNEIEEFSLILKKNKVLTYLDLNFTHCHKLTNETLFCLSYAFGSFHALSVLRITSLESEKFYTQGFKTFFLSLERLQSLRELKLSFIRGLYLNDEDLKFLSQALEGLKCLSVLDLDCSACRNITDAALEILSFALKNLKNLRKFFLRFDGALTDEGFDNFGSFLKGMKSLFYFELSAYISREGGYGSTKKITSSSRNQLRLK